MTGIGRERIDLNGTGLDWAGREQTPLNRLDRIKLDWSTPSADWTGLSLAEFDFSRLHYPRLNWKVPYRIVSSLHLARLICTELHCTFPNETNKDCTALHVNVVHWTTQDIFIQRWK